MDKQGQNEKQQPTRYRKENYRFIYTNLKTLKLLEVKLHFTTPSNLQWTLSTLQTHVLNIYELSVAGRKAPNNQSL
jgi:hypothetical protein